MPMFTLRTTVARIPDNFFKETATLLGQLLGKPADVRDAQFALQQRRLFRCA
jgi:hypothetical protein